MVKFVWFFILLFFKLNCTFPADLTASTVIREHGRIIDVIGSNKSTDICSRSTGLTTNDKNKERKLIDFDKVSSEIKHAVRRFEEVKSANSKSLPKISKHTNGKPVLLNENAEGDIAKHYAPSEQGNLKDLKEFEKYVIIKKNPYAELDGLQYRSVSLASNIAPSENQPKTSSHFFGDQSISQISDDDVQNIEIVSRGLTGFEIPTNILLESKSTNATIEKSSVSEENKVLHTEVESIVDKLKKLINEYEEKRRNVK